MSANEIDIVMTWLDFREHGNPCEITQMGFNGSERLVSRFLAPPTFRGVIQGDGYRVYKPWAEIAK